MLAYRHAFHAGNHADVLKHTVLLAVLRHMAGKDKGFRIVDSHAGAGGYALLAPQAQKHAEYRDGIGRLWPELATPAAGRLPPLLADYLAQVAAFNAAAGSGEAATAASDTPPAATPELVSYPGSPALARALLRPQDDLRLFELHPTDHALLARQFDGDRQVQVRQADGFAGLRAVLPPPTRRGVLLIDPSYELKIDYAAVLAACREALTRFADAVLLVWYPQLLRRESQQIAQRLKSVAAAQAKKGWLHARLTVGVPDAQGFGLIGSGVFVINPPHTLRAGLAAALPLLQQRLARQGSGDRLLEAGAGA